MKRFRVIHRTTYDFSDIAELGAHTLRLRPREGHDQRIESSTLTIDCNSVVQKFDISPQDFLVDDYAVNYPFSYAAEDRLTLSPYTQCGGKTDCSALKKWFAKVWSPVQSIQTFELLLLLNQHIYTTLNYVKRDEEGVQSSLTTLNNNEGSCRDLANLFIDIARSLGFAARFVSGYVYTEDVDDLSGTTHAWAEVLIPGAGWKGFDPTHGCLVGAYHIAVSVSRLPELVPSVSGIFWGLSDSSLIVDVWVTEIS